MPERKDDDPWGIFDGIRGPVGEGDDTANENLLESGADADDEKRRLRKALVRVLARNDALTSPPAVYGTVVRLVSRTLVEPVSDYGALVMGAKVRIIKHPDPKRVGVTGHILHQPVVNEQSPDHGMVLIALVDGQIVEGSVVPDPKGVRSTALELVYQPLAAVAIDGRLIEVEYPAELTLAPGDTVAISQKTTHILRVVPDGQPMGEVANVLRIDHDQVEVELRDATKMVSAGKLADTLTVGKRALLDPTGSVAVRVLPGEEGEFAIRRTIPTLSLDDVGGQRGAKDVIRRSILRPLRNPRRSKAYGKKASCGAVFYGPPGCGKSRMALVIASLVAQFHRELHGDDGAPLGFLNIAGPELLEGIVGRGERKLHHYYEWARWFRQTYGYRPILFIDEADAPFKKRGSSVSQDATDTLVNQELIELQDMEDDPAAYTIIATNRLDIIDPAIIRDGRLNDKVEFTRPSLDEAVEVFIIYLRENILLAPGLDVQTLAHRAAAGLYDPRYILYQVRMSLDGDKAEETRPLTLGFIASGAMILAIVEKAKDLAMDRDDAAGTETDSGVSEADLNAAVEAKFQEQTRLEHPDDYKLFVGDATENVLDIKKLRQVQGRG